MSYAWIPHGGVDKENAEKQGYLKKEGYAWKSVQRRWFVLKDEWLYYYSDHSSKTPIGGINLNGAILKYNPAEGIKKKVGYWLSLTAPRASYQKNNHFLNRTYHFYADTLEDRNHWASSISRALKSILKPTILVTGASGTVGSHVVKALMNKSVRIVAAVHSKSAQIEALGIEVVKIDVNNPASIDKAMQNVDKLFILNHIDVKMAENTKALVAAAKKAGVRHIVRMGAAGTETRGIALARWHSDAEQEVVNSGIPYTFIRPNNFYSNYAMFYSDTIKKEGKFYAPHGNGKVSYVDPADIAEAIATVLTSSVHHAGKAYVITGPEAFSNDQAAAELSKQLSRKVSYVDIPPEAAIAGMKQYGMPEIIANGLGELNHIMKSGYCATVSSDFERVVGRKPTTFAKWLSNNLAPFKGTTVLVIGATGMMGKEVINHLSSHAKHGDIRVIAAARDVHKASNFASQGVELISLDMDKPESIDHAMKGVDRVFLLSPITPDMAKQAKTVAEAAKKHGVKHIVRMGGMGSNYRAIKLGVWHDDAEKEIAKSGIPHTFVRPNSLMSNYLLYSQESIKYTNIIYGSLGEGKTSYVHPSDVGAVAAAVLLDPKGHEGKAYDVTGNEALDSKTVAKIFSEQLQKQVNYVDVPAEASKKGMLDGGMPELIVDSLLELVAVQKANQAAHVSDAMKQVTGRLPITFRDYVTQNIRAFKTETTVFVSGAAGNIGSLLVKKLVEQKVRVIAGIRSLKKADPLLAAGAEVVEYDANDAASTELALRGADKLFLLVPFNMNLVPQVKNLIAAAKKVGVQHIVKLSGIGADERNHPAALLHREGDKLVQDSGLSYTILRPSNFMSNVVLYGAGAVKAQSTFYSGTGDGQIGWVDPSDVAESAAVVLTQPGHENRAYDLTGPELLSAPEVTNTLSKVLGKQIKYVDLNREAIYQGALKQGTPEKEAAARADMLEDFRNNGAKKLSDTVEKLTGHKPTSIVDYLSRNKKFFKGKTVLVCGATGTVGGEVVKNLVNDPEVRILAGVRSASKAAPLLSLDVEYVVVDFNKPETLDEAVKGVDAIFILTSMVENMVEQTKNLVDAAKKGGVKFIVKSSAIGADSKPGIQLGRWHNEAELYIKQSGIPFCFVRPNSFLQNFIWNNSATIKNHGTLYMPLGDGAVSYVDARDIGRSVAAILSSPDKHAGRTYTLTGPEAYTCADVAAAITKAVGSPVVYYDLPLDNAKATWAASGWPQWLRDSLSELFTINKLGYTAWTSNDVLTITGREPVGLQDFINENKALFAPQVPDEINVAIIGYGVVGVALANAFTKAGHHVQFGVRDPKSEKVAAALAKVERVTAETVENAVKFGQVVVFAVQFKDLEAAISGAGDLTGKIVVDATNPVVFQNGKLSLTIGTTTSAGEKCAEWAKGARVVKAFNTMGYGIMENPKFDTSAADLHIAGDDNFAKQYVAKLGSDIGFTPLDVGGIEMARTTEALALLWITLSFKQGRGIAFKLLRQ